MKHDIKLVYLKEGGKTFYFAVVILKQEKDLCLMAADILSLWQSVK